VSFEERGFYPLRRLVRADGPPRRPWSKARSLFVGSLIPWALLGLDLARMATLGPVSTGDPNSGWVACCLVAVLISLVAAPLTIAAEWHREETHRSRRREHQKQLERERKARDARIEQMEREEGFR
jgi:hypothetical protein